MTTPNRPLVRPDIRLTKPVPAGCETILSREALEFVAALEVEFRDMLDTLLGRRSHRQQEIDEGALPDFPFSSRVRKEPWTVAPIPANLLDRRVEITGPTERKLMINALNSGANVFMADLEDSNVPTWDNMVQGQKNLFDAVRKTMTYTAPGGKEYRLRDDTATLMMRPRGLHLCERHMLVDGRPVSASLFDFGLFFFHNARVLVECGSGPYIYIPKLEHTAEARFWNEVFLMAQNLQDIPRGSIRATVLIETIHAVFEMEEILYELREHSAGLNCGRWDYLFSFIKTFQKHRTFLFPERSALTMSARFLRAYSQLLVQTCHRRGIHAIGGMSAFIPVNADNGANKNALKRVRLDKDREVLDGHDGTWVAHPGLVTLAREVFDARMPGQHQIHNSRNDVLVTKRDLLAIPAEEISSRGFGETISVALQYLASWVSGKGCVPINHLMEDTATAEICRSLLWHWIHHPDARVSGKTGVTAKLYQDTVNAELLKIRHEQKDRFDQPLYTLAASILDSMVLNGSRLDSFLTIRAQEHLP